MAEYTLEEKVEYTADIIVVLVNGASRVEETLVYIEEATPEQLGEHGESVSRHGCSTLKNVSLLLSGRVQRNVGELPMGPLMRAIEKKLAEEHPRWGKQE